MLVRIWAMACLGNLRRESEYERFPQLALYLYPVPELYLNPKLNKKRP